MIVNVWRPIQETPVLNWSLCALGDFHTRNDGFCSRNDEFCCRYDEFSVANDGTYILKRVLICALDGSTMRQGVRLLLIDL